MVGFVVGGLIGFGLAVDVEKSEGGSVSPEEPDTHVFRRADPESEETPRSFYWVPPDLF